jgi:signal recognition particle receptor subunit beta
MVFFNHATRQMTAKIVYYGPGLCGKTTNLNTIYGKTSQKARGEMVSLNTETDRTLFFDLLPMDVGMVGGFKTKLQLYTVPGQVFYNSTRKLVLKGVDGIVFVVDSQTAMLDACRESYQNLAENLKELGLHIEDLPLVYQWNKRDLKNVVPVEELESIFNTRGVPSFQSVASDGSGVFETLRGITRLALSHIKTHVLGEGQAAPEAPAPVPVPPPAPKPSVEALTLSDLPSVTDLLDMEPPRTAAAGLPPGPLADEDEDDSFFIEAPMLPEPPEGTLEREASPDVAAALETRELPTLDDLPAPREAPAEPALGEAAAPPAAVMAPIPSLEPVIPGAKPALRPKVDPLAALAGLKVEARKPAAPKAKIPDAKEAISSLLGELTLVGRSGAPSVLRLEVPTDLEGQELEVVVQLRTRGQVVAEGQLHRPVPAKGATAKLTVELKRS